MFRRNMGLFPFATRFSRTLQLAFVANARPTVYLSASTTLENLRTVLLSSIAPLPRDYSVIFERLSSRFNARPVIWRPLGKK